MADRLKRRLVVFLALAALAPLTLAQTPLADPTRPPPGAQEPAGEPGAASGPVLQSVLIPKRGQPLALISGQQVRLGQRYGASRLIKLSEREAVLEGPDGVQRLPLTPGVEKTATGVAGQRSGRPAPVGGRP